MAGTQLNKAEVEGMLTGPFLEGDVRGGQGALAASAEGLLWRLRSGVRNRSGLVQWALITKWEARCQGPENWLVVVHYDGGERNGRFRLHLGGASAARRLTDSVRPYLQDTLFDVELPEG
jgi:hypothetical protein